MEAVPWITKTLTLVLSYLAFPERSEVYTVRPGREDEALSALDELESVRLTA